mgnify:FL=1
MLTENHHLKSKVGVPIEIYRIILKYGHNTVSEHRMLGYCAKEVQTLDRDRFLMTLFAPAHARDALFTLYAFNLEIAKIRESVSEPILAEMRFQWWRDAIDGIYNGAPPQHPVVQPLHDVIYKFNLKRERFESLIHARAIDIATSPPSTLAQFMQYGSDTTTPLVFLALEILGPVDESLRSIAQCAATAWAVTGLLRALPYNLRHRRNYLPTEMMAEYELDLNAVTELRPSRELARLIQSVSNTACSNLNFVQKGRGAIHRKYLTPLLIAPLARQYNRRFARANYNIFDPIFAEAPPLRAWPLISSVLLGRV